MECKTSTLIFDSKQQQFNYFHNDVGLYISCVFFQDNDRRANYLTDCNRNIGQSTVEDDVPHTSNTPPHTSLSHQGPHTGPRYVSPGQQSPKRIHTNFIPLAFNSHRSWLERIHLGSISSTDEFSHLLDSDDDDIVDADVDGADTDEADFDDTDVTEDLNHGEMSFDEQEINTMNVSGDLQMVEENPHRSSANDNHRTTNANCVDNNNIQMVSDSGNSRQHDFELDFDTLPQSDNILWACNNSTSSYLHDNRLQSSVLSLTALENHSNGQGGRILNEQTLASDVGETDNAVNLSEDPSNSPEGGEIHPRLDESNEPPTNTYNMEHVGSTDNMPESLRFLFQPLSYTTSNPETVPFEPGLTLTSSNPTVSEVSLNGYDHLPEPRAESHHSSSSQTSSLVNLQQNWYIYDPRLNPVNRRGRVDVHLQWQGVRTALSMPAMIGPPDYEDLSSHNEDETTMRDTLEPPPPYVADPSSTDVLPPPTYDEAILESLFTEVSQGDQGNFSNSSPGMVLPQTLSLHSGCNRNFRRGMLGFDTDGDTTTMAETSRSVEHLESRNRSYRRGYFLGLTGGERLVNANQIQARDQELLAESNEDLDDDLDTNVVFASNSRNTDNLLDSSVPGHLNLLDEDAVQEQWRVESGQRTRQSPSALQAGFLNPRGRPAVAWTGQRWGENHGNQSNFGINSRLLSITGSRF